MKKNKQGKSIFGVIKFVSKVMTTKDKWIFAILVVLFSLSGISMMLPAQITAMLVSMIQGEPVMLFGISLGDNLNIWTILIFCGLLQFLPEFIIIMLQYFKNAFALKIHLKVQQQAFGWTTIPRKNSNLGMTLGDATYRITQSIEDLEWVISTLFDSILPSIFTAVSCAVYIIILEIWALPILLVGLILVIVAFLIRRKVETPLTVKGEKYRSRINNFLVNTIGNLPIINIFKSANFERKNLSDRTDNYLSVQKKRYLTWFVYWSVMTLIDIVSIYSIISISSLKAVGGVILASQVILILSYVGNVYSPIQNFGWFINIANQLMVKINRLEELRPTKENSIDLSKDNYNKPIEKITLQNVCVKNDDDTYIDNLSYTIEKGKLTVITGESGGGKTTSIRALIGLCERESGDIIINDEYKAYSMYYFIDRFSVVMQSPFIFNRDVRDNIYYPEVKSSPYLRQAITDLNMDKIISKEYDEDSEQEMDLKLSGGEKKRICVLRGLIQEKEVYVFDEPTNELDAMNTNVVLDYINKLKKNAIVVVVTHDKRMIDRADKVITINNCRPVKNS